MVPYIQADVAWCNATLGRLEPALRAARHAQEAVQAGDIHVDDCAATHSRLAATFSLLRAGDSSKHQQLADSEWKRYEILQRETV